MLRRKFLLLFLLLNAAAAWPARSQDTPERLRVRLAAETDPIRKTRLAVRLAELELDTARKEYDAGEWEKGGAALERLLDSVEQAYRYLSASHRDARKNPSGFKDTEIKLRQMYRRLDDLRASLPLDERPTVDKVMARIHEIQQLLLDAVMHVKPKKEGR